MARINIEDELFKDNRFFELTIKLGARAHAIGALVEAWLLAQKYVSPSNPRGLVPLRDWEVQKICPEVAQVGLAFVVNNKVEVVGAQEHFAWLVQAQESGKKGGLAKALKSLKTDPSDPRGTLKEPYLEPYPLPLTLPLPLPLSLTPALSQNTEEAISPVKPARQHRVIELWNSLAIELPPVKKSNAQRLKLCQAAIEAWGEEGLAEIFKSVSLSDFLNGRTDSGTWKASFDWCLKPGNLIKISEGNYANKPGAKSRRLTNSELNVEAAKDLLVKFSKEGRNVGPEESDR